MFASASQQQTLLCIAASAGVLLLLQLVPNAGAHPIVDGESLSVSFRTTVAQAIRDNLARQQQFTFAPANGQQTTIEFPGTAAARSSASSAATATAAPPAPPTLPVLTALRGPTAAPAAAVPTTPIAPQVASRVAEQPLYNDIDAEVPAEDIATLAAMEHERSKNAHYSFDSSVQDTINGHSHTRQETRDGLSLRGSYSYSDGFFQRTVHYEADEGGYRVTK